jgi:hypothetical protein
MDQTVLLQIAEKMIRMGGSFAQSIGKALIVADSSNRQRLIDAFPELIKQYSK